MAEYAWRPLGELLVQRGLIDDYQLESLLLEQRLSGKLFGELLVAKHVVSPMDMAAVIAQQHGLHLAPEARPSPASPRLAQAWRPLGRILVDRELLTESGLQRVLLSQRRTEASSGSCCSSADTSILSSSPGRWPSSTAWRWHRKSSLRPSSSRYQPEDVAYEVRAPNGAHESALHVTPSFLDASDFAFELIYDQDPDALEIVEVKGGRATDRLVVRAPGAAAT